LHKGGKGLDKYPSIKKCLGVGIILLFIGVVFVPSINFNVVKASNDNKFVEVATQACGIKGYGDTTVKLTRQQYQNLKQYLVEFRVRLNQTTTREETVPLFNEAIVELNKYGLLPKGMSIAVGQKLVKGNFDEMIRRSFSKESSNTNQRIIQNNTNMFCFLAGKTSGTIFASISDLKRFITTVPLPFLIATFFSYLYKLHPSHVTELLEMIAVDLADFVGILSFLKAIELFGVIAFGFNFFNLFAMGASGWVTSIGLNGRVKWNDYFIGTILGEEPILPLWFYIGAVGFTGIKIYFINPPDFYSIFFGSALEIKLKNV
jgi:hypothetical protein